ncbi:response regulator [Terriglobus tenax]|uniref:response regulator n=1 Tax=Terriglobus tenax TaxID=1111115 RepID=UPI0021DF6C61|nr:response regulator [Terriglobus tenax]
MPRQPTILFVDDEPLLLQLFPIWLARQGYHVLTAASGEDALKVLAGEAIDALLVDYNLPGMNGPQLIEQCGGRPAILLASGLEEIADEEQHRLNIIAVLSKPIQRDQMLAALAQAAKL